MACLICAAVCGCGPFKRCLQMPPPARMLHPAWCWNPPPPSWSCAASQACEPNSPPRPAPPALARHGEQHAQHRQRLGRVARRVRHSQQRLPPSLCHQALGRDPEPGAAAAVALQLPGLTVQWCRTLATVVQVAGRLPCAVCVACGSAPLPRCCRPGWRVTSRLPPPAVALCQLPNRGPVQGPNGGHCKAMNMVACGGAACLPLSGSGRRAGSAAVRVRRMPGSAGAAEKTDR